MTDELQYVSEIGRKLEDTRGTDPITNDDPPASKTFFNFGFLNRSFGKFPQLASEIIESRTGTSYDANSFNVGKTSVMGNIASVVTNGLGLYYSLCRKESSAGVYDGGVANPTTTEIWTITPITSGELQSYTTRYHRKNIDTANIQKSIPLCQTLQYTLSLDNTTVEKLPLAQTESLFGQQVQAVAANTSDYTLQQPDTKEVLFYWDNSANSLFTWDTESASVELKTALRSMSFTINNANRLIYKSGQHFPHWNQTGGRVMVMTAEFEARNDTSIFDDYMSQAGNTAVPADDFKNVNFKIGNANSKYIQLGFTDIGITELSMNDAFREGGDIPTYQLQAKVRLVAPVIKDGITTKSFYGVS